MIPDDIFPRTRQLLTPFVTTVEDRDALVTEAFFLHDPIVSNIALEGAPKTFCVKLIKKLINYGCLTTDEHSLARLLTTLRYDCGVDKHPEIDELVGIMNAVCGDDKPLVADKPDPTPIESAPITIDTPKDDRKPTIFISYSRQDTETAQKLIADLNKAGHACWIDTTKIKGGDQWIMTISEGIINSYAFVPILSQTAMDSTWVRKEVLWAVDRKKLIVPMFIENVFEHPFFFLLKDVQGVTVFDSNYEMAVAKLLSYLPNPTLADVDVTEAELDGDDTTETLTISEPRAIPRKLELAYMERLQFEELLNTEKYTAMGGHSQQMGKHAEIRAVFELLPIGDKHNRTAEPEPFEDAVTEIQRIQRAVLLGEPGGGKTTTIWKLASDLVDKALNDRHATIPLLIRLGKWTDATQPLHAFIASQIGDLGAYLDDLLREKRVALLLDGLNEIPASQHKSKYAQVQAFIEAYPNLIAVVSCRELDYTIDLGFDRINITPLDPIRIREFIYKYLGMIRGGLLFNELVGAENLAWWDRFKERFEGRLQNLDQVFWVEKDLPSDLAIVVLTTGSTVNRDHDFFWRWVKIRDNPSGLMVLAHNPYMLLMLTSVFAKQGELPDNRGELFKEFVETLMERENVPEDEQEPLVNSLAQVAYEMQLQRIADNTNDGDTGHALTVLPEDDVKRILGERLLYLAGSASILSVGEQVRFTHQLLQEYFAATYMDNEIKAGRLKATDIWKSDKWWERTNWEEAAILLAGLYSDGPTPIVEWLMDVQPELAAQCITRSGSKAPPDATLLKLRERWLPRLTDLENDPSPYARAAVGRALGQLNLSNGEMLDNRKGVSILVKNGVKLPDIDWMTIPDDGEWIYQDNKNEPLPEFRISRYPITYAQFQTFIDDPEGYSSTNYDWFEGLNSDADDQKMHDQRFQFSNHPREMVNWYQAIAFCRWLSWRLGGEYSLDEVGRWLARLPTEFEWEKAARGTDGREYPWGDGYKIGYANIDETSSLGSVENGQYDLDQTTAVGAYSHADSPYGVLDMSGNVWDWCLTDRQNPQVEVSAEDLTTSFSRVLRGGSWLFNLIAARSAYRSTTNPKNHDFNIGFRICSSPNSITIP